MVEEPKTCGTCKHTEAREYDKILCSGNWIRSFDWSLRAKKCIKYAHR